jgi:hypothetical protein
VRTQLRDVELLTPDGSGSGEAHGTCDLGTLQDIAPKAAAGGPTRILGLLKEVALSVVHHAANDGIKFIVRKQIDFAFHFHLLLFDEGTIRIV